MQGSVWGITWVSLVAVAAASALVMAGLSQGAATDALAHSLEDHVTAQAGLAAVAVSELPVETLVEVGGSHSGAVVAGRLDALRAGGRLHEVVLLGPSGVVLGAEGVWLPGRAEEDLIARARAGESVSGPLYAAEDGELYMTAYHPLPGHPGWLAAVEGSGATLRAADRLRRTQGFAGIGMLVLVAVGATLLASGVTAPLNRLDRALAGVVPGTHRDPLPVEGPREVRRVAETVNALLDAIRERDSEIGAAHDARVEELTRLAAGIAHEIRNPLNAMSLTAQRLGRLHDTDQRAVLADRLRDQVHQLEVIVQRLVDLNAPIVPRTEALDLRDVVASSAADSTLGVEIGGTARVLGDRVMLAQVVRNLLLNAEQAGATGMRFTLTPLIDGTAMDATDDGAGVPDEVAAHLFAWFHTTRAQGSGLGLPQSRRLVEAMGGTLELVALRPATFRLWMPAP